MTNVLMLPKPSEARVDDSNAINQICLRMEKLLPNYGYRLVEDPYQAELVVGNAGQCSGVGQVDVAMLHGLYPTAYPELTMPWHYAANAAVIENIRGAKQHTVPSEWVADQLRRDCHINPHVIPWGIEPDEWYAGENGNYILWAKTRAEGVCNPKPLLELAAQTPAMRFLTTFGENPTPNVRVIGRQTFSAMQPLIRSASVYLGTVLETGAIQVLEAMASSVPVLGYRWGATADFVEHGVTGYLVEPGDIEGLREGLDYCLKHRATLGANAREVARAYTWQRVVERMAAVYASALKPHTGARVSVIILSHNYGHYLQSAIDSVKAQQTDFEFEIIGVDNGSTDNTAEIFTQAGVKLIQRENDGPAGGRNAGIVAAKGEYLTCLDADDMLGNEHFLQVLADALDKDRALGIAFTGLRLMDENGNLGKKTDWPNGYDYQLQRQGFNQVPTACMFRREAWQRAGGYRGRYTPAEDANLWVRIGALGYRAQQVVDDGWFYYRWHDQSLSTPVRMQRQEEPYWLDMPWTNDGQMPFAADGRPEYGSYPVRHYIKSKVTIIVPVGPGHEKYLPDALDSIEAQTERYWECIVVNDTGAALNLTAYPWARLIDTGGKKGAGYARNRGIEVAKTKLIAFLDADDIFHMRFLERTLREYALTGKYIYTDWYSLAKSGKLEIHETPAFDPNEVFQRTSIHSINVLMLREWALAVGGFDESMYSAEDVDFFMKLAAAGHCGRRVGESLVTYRYQTGVLRERGMDSDSLKLKADILALFNARYGEYIRGEKNIVCRETSRLTTQNGQYKVYAGENGSGGMVRIEYHGPGARAACVAMGTGTNYGQRANSDIFLVWQKDVAAEPTRFLPIAEFENEIVATPVPPEPELVRA